MHFQDMAIRIRVYAASIENATTGKKKHSNKGGPKPRLVREACVQDTRVDKERLLPIGLWTLVHPPNIYVPACRV